MVLMPFLHVTWLLPVKLQLPLDLINQHHVGLRAYATNMHEFTFWCCPVGLLWTCWGCRNNACAGLFLEQVKGRIECGGRLKMYHVGATECIHSFSDPCICSLQSAMQMMQKMTEIVADFVELMSAALITESSRGSWSPPGCSLIGWQSCGRICADVAHTRD